MEIVVADLLIEDCYRQASADEPAQCMFCFKSPKMMQQHVRECPDRFIQNKVDFARSKAEESKVIVSTITLEHPTNIRIEYKKGETMNSVTFDRVTSLIFNSRVKFPRVV